jgi:hypothetical protein
MTGATVQVVSKFGIPLYFNVSVPTERMQEANAFVLDPLANWIGTMWDGRIPQALMYMGRV